MKDLSFLIPKEKSKPSMVSNILVGVTAFIFIFLIIASVLSSSVIPAIIAWGFLAICVFIFIYSCKLNSISYDSYMQLSDDEKRLMKNQIQKYIETQSTEFGVLTDIGMLDEDFFIRWEHIREVRFTSLKYDILNLLLGYPLDPIPGCCKIKGIVDLNGKKHKVAHSITIRPTRDMSSEIDKFIEFASGHNPRVSIINDYRFVH